MPRDYKKDCPCPHHPFGCFGHPNSCECTKGQIDYDEALRMIRKHMKPGDTLGQMFMRVAKALEDANAAPSPS